MKKRVLRWGGNLITALLAVLMVATTYCAITSRVSGAPKVLGLQMYEVLSGSMEPGIHTGSVIFDRLGVDVEKLKIGDVITFKAADNPAMLITHRIIQVKSDNGAYAFQVKGDANDAPDPTPVLATNVVAQYANITIPYLGFYLNFMKSKMGIILLVIVPGALLIVTTMVGLLREILKLEKAKKLDSVDVTPETPSKA